MTAAARVLVLLRRDEEAEMIARLLASSCGFEVDLTTDPAAALSHLPGSGVGAVVLGYDLGADAGLRALHAIRQLRDDAATVPVVVVADRDRSSDRVQAWEGGADAVLTKPFHIDDLIEALRSSMDRSMRNRERARHDALARERAGDDRRP